VKKKKVFCKMLENIQTHPKQQIQHYKCTRKKGKFKLQSIEEVSTTRRKTLMQNRNSMHFANISSEEEKEENIWEDA
jgi:hypothetical protein